MSETNDILFNLSRNELDSRIDELLLNPLELNFLDESLDEEPLIGGLLYTGTPQVTEFLNQKWNAAQKRIEFSIQNNEMSGFFEANNNINELFRQINETYVEPISSNRIIQYVIDHDTFERPIRSVYMKKSQIDVAMSESK